MGEDCDGSGIGVDARQVWPFASITAVAGERCVAGIVVTAVLLGYDVVYMVEDHFRTFGKEAVIAFSVGISFGLTSGLEHGCCVEDAGGVWVVAG